MRVIAIDPGNTESAYVVIDGDRRPLWFDKLDNHRLLRLLALRWDFWDCDTAAIEMVESYGMPVGREVFDTCVWTGRFYEGLVRTHRGSEPQLTYRSAIKLHLCGSVRAKDTNIRQALVDRFAPGQPNHGKGTKAEPGWFYGFRADIWQAFALAVYVADTTEAARVAAEPGGAR